MEKKILTIYSSPYPNSFIYRSNFCCRTVQKTGSRCLKAKSTTRTIFRSGKSGGINILAACKCSGICTALKSSYIGSSCRNVGYSTTLVCILLKVRGITSFCSEETTCILTTYILPTTTE